MNIEGSSVVEEGESSKEVGPYWGIVHNWLVGDLILFSKSTIHIIST